MGQAITDYTRFLGDARDAVYRLNCDQNTAGQLSDEEARWESELEATRKEVEDSIQQTIRKRLDEINSSYDKEIGKGQERLKRVRAKREKAKSQGMKERIAEETRQLREHNQELKVQMRILFQKNQAPAFCRSTFYYALYYPRGLREIGLFLLTLVLCFLAVPCGIYFLLIQQRQMWMLAAIYFADVLLIGGAYVMVGNRTRLRYQDTLKRGRDIRNTLRSNRKKIKVITRSIQRDGDEALYDLEKYDDEIAQAEQELSELVSKKRDALITFENVTKNIISDEIMENNRKRLNELEASCVETAEALKKLESSIKEQNLHITDTYGPYLGNEFLKPERLTELLKLFQNGSASNLTEAMELYKRAQSTV